MLDEQAHVTTLSSARFANISKPHDLMHLRDAHGTLAEPLPGVVPA
jgi:hypothetical protein